jgi:hypothetical protein
MALTKVQAEGVNLADTFAFSGTVSGLPSGSGAFAARMTSNSWAVIGNGAIVPFNNVSTGNSFDTDGVFNTSTYKFTAPATGVYTFWFSIYTSQNDSSNSFAFLKNSSIIDLQNSVNNLATYASSTADNSLSFTCVLPLASGDTMAVCGAVENSDYYTGHCQWGGCRLA